jgi:predicted nucleic acid-binding protein
MTEIGLLFDSVSAEAATIAGTLWQEYRRQARGARNRIVSDYLIGAHALLRADTLLTRDRGFYRRYFSNLDVTDPAQA